MSSNFAGIDIKYILLGLGLILLFLSLNVTTPSWFSKSKDEKSNIKIKTNDVDENTDYRTKESRKPKRKTIPAHDHIYVNVEIQGNLLSKCKICGKDEPYEPPCEHQYIVVDQYGKKACKYCGDLYDENNDGIVPMPIGNERETFWLTDGE